MEQVHMRGWLDTRDRVQQVFKKDEVAETPPFIQKAQLYALRTATPSTMSAATTICVHIRYLMKKLPNPSKDKLFAATIGEFMAPVLPAERSLTEERADSELQQILNHLITQPNTYFDQYSVQTWVSDLKVSGQAKQELPDSTKLSLTEKIDYLIALANKLEPTQFLNLTEVYLACYLSVAKRGTVTCRPGMVFELQILLKVDSKIIKNVYDWYGRYFDAENNPQIMKRWYSEIPLRLRFVLQEVLLTHSNQAPARHPL